MAGRLTDEGNAYLSNNFIDHKVISKKKKKTEWRETGG